MESQGARAPHQVDELTQGKNSPNFGRNFGTSGEIQPVLFVVMALHASPDVTTVRIVVPPSPQRRVRVTAGLV